MAPMNFSHQKCSPTVFLARSVMLTVAKKVAEGADEEAANVLDILEPGEVNAAIGAVWASKLHPMLALAVSRSKRHQHLGEKYRGWISEAVRRDLARDLVLKDAQTALRAEGVRFLLLKGACFRSLLYSRSWLRQMTDVDLFVAKRDFERASRALEKSGFCRQISYPARPFSMKFSTEGQFFHPCGGLIELHTGPTYERFGLRVDDASVFLRAKESAIGPIPCWEDHLLFLAINQVRSSASAILRPMLDMALIIETQGLDWDVVLHRSKEWGCSGMLFICIEIVRSLFGSQVPAEVRQSCIPRGLRGALLRALFLYGPNRFAQPKTVRSPVLFRLASKSRVLGAYALAMDRFGGRALFVAWLLISRTLDIAYRALTVGSVF